MKPVAPQILGVAFAALALAACTSHPLYNLKDAPINTPAGVARTTPDVEKAIRTAGAKHGWKMESPRPGVMVGTTTWRSHSMTVDITYDTRRYSIVYKDSANLGYDGTNIHRNYNYKVQELDRAIQDQLAVF
jgi:hypothetical protein